MKVQVLREKVGLSEESIRAVLNVYVQRCHTLQLIKQFSQELSKAEAISLLESQTAGHK